MSRRAATDPNPKAVYVWTCRVRGTTTATAAYARRRNAKTWIEAQIGEDGEWNECGTGVQSRYDSGPDTGILEIRELPDALGIILPDSPVA